MKFCLKIFLILCIFLISCKQSAFLKEKSSTQIQGDNEEQGFKKEYDNPLEVAIDDFNFFHSSNFKFKQFITTF